MSVWEISAALLRQKKLCVLIFGKPGALRRGYNLTHRSRPVRTSDFEEFDWILGMDDRNIDALKEKAPDIASEQKIHRMTDFCRTNTVDYVPDPYYGGAQGFEHVLDILEDACAGLLETLRTEL